MSDLDRILKLAGMNGLYETDVEQAQVREADWRNMRPDSEFGDDPDAAANLRYHLEQAEKYANELGNYTIASALNSFLEVSMGDDE